jgi:hypothetical protein
MHEKVQRDPFRREDRPGSPTDDGQDIAFLSVMSIGQLHVERDFRIEATKGAPRKAEPGNATGFAGNDQCSCSILQGHDGVGG